MIQSVYNKWSECTRCILGERRESEGQSTLLGQGARGGIFIVMDAPTWKNEKDGSLFATEGGQLLYQLLEQLGVRDRVFVTFAMACRSCKPKMLEDGTPLMRKSYNGRLFIQYRDTEPELELIKTCAERVHEEIYAVDPKVILACGDTALTSVMGKSAKVFPIRGVPTEVEIHSPFKQPRLTEKKHVWGRKVSGQLLFGMDPGTVKYLTIPTHSLDYVIKSAADTRAESPSDQFIQDLKAALGVLEMGAELGEYTQEWSAKDKAEEEVEEETYGEEDEDD